MGTFGAMGTLDAMGTLGVMGTLCAMGTLGAVGTLGAMGSPGAMLALTWSPQPDALLSSVLTHPLLAASSLLPWDRRFSQPCSTASAAAGVLLSLSAPLPGRGRGPLDSPERPLPEERCCGGEGVWMGMGMG